MGRNNGWQDYWIYLVILGVVLLILGARRLYSLLARGAYCRAIFWNEESCGANRRDHLFTGIHVVTFKKRRWTL